MTGRKLRMEWFSPAISGRCLPRQEFDAVIDSIENQIFNMEEKEVPTSVIGELVMDKLKELDEVAYVRFDPCTGNLRM